MHDAMREQFLIDIEKSQAPEHAVFLSQTFGDGAYVEKMFASGMPPSQIAFCLINNNKHLSYMLSCFFNQQIQTNSVPFEKKVDLLEGVLQYVISWWSNNAIFKILPHGEYSAYFQALFSLDKTTETLRIFRGGDGFTDGVLTQEYADILIGYLPLIEEEASRDLVKNFLMEHSSLSALYSCMGHSLLGEDCYLVLKNQFLSSIEHWKQQYPELFVRMEKDMLLKEVLLSTPALLPTPSKKM